MQSRIARRIEYYKNKGYRFNVRHKGSTCEITMPDWNKKMNFSDKRAYMEGIHLCGMVRRDVASRIASGQYKTGKYSIWHRIPVSYYIPDNIKPNIHAVAIDIKSCYWRAAFLMGIISGDTYEKGYKKDDEYKLARNASIGSLGRFIRDEQYENGELKKTDINRDALYPVRFDVLNFVNQLARRIIEACYDGFYMFITDCFYVKPEYEQLVKDMLTQFNFECRSMPVTILDIREESYSDVIRWMAKGKPHALHFNINSIFTQPFRNAGR